MPAACPQQGPVKVACVPAKQHLHLSAVPSSTSISQLCQAAPASPSCACSPPDHCMGMAGPGLRAGGLHSHHPWSGRHLRPAGVPGAAAAAHNQCIPRYVCTTAAMPNHHVIWFSRATQQQRELTCCGSNREILSVWPAVRSCQCDDGMTCRHEAPGQHTGGEHSPHGGRGGADGVAVLRVWHHWHAAPAGRVRPCIPMCILLKWFGMWLHSQ